LSDIIGRPKWKDTERRTLKTRGDRLDCSVAADDDSSSDFRRDDTSPIGLLRASVRYIVSGALEYSTENGTVGFPAEGIWIMDKGDLHILEKRQGNASPPGCAWLRRTIPRSNPNEWADGVVRYIFVTKRLWYSI